MVLFGTGGETHGGSLWVISMTDLLQADNTKVKGHKQTSFVSIYFVQMIRRTVFRGANTFKRKSLSAQMNKRITM